MRSCFLTSNPTMGAGETLNPANGFAEELKRALPARINALVVCSDPDGFDRTDVFARKLARALQNEGFGLQECRVLDRRTQKDAAELLGAAELVILAGGHVPTQNRFFRELGLKALLQGFGGTILGISAGSMNSADVVYAQPELPGEAADPRYEKFLPGLGLTKTMLLPHYQLTKDETLDGMKLFGEITGRDSMGRRFYAIPDGSYLFIRGQTEELRGEAHLVENGTIRQLASEGGRLALR